MTVGTTKQGYIFLFHIFKYEIYILNMRIAIKVAYDGRKFHGFAIQPDKRTVEGEILKMLRKKGVIEDKARFQYASRTDRGVSAMGNVISFNCRGNAVRVLENMDDIWIVGYAKVDEKFNPRYCKSKIYRYYLYNDGYDVEEMKRIATLFVGEHDFSSFARIDSRNPVRKIYDIKIENRGEIVTFDFTEKSFLWNQVRRMMGAIMMAGRKKVDENIIREALHGKKRMNFGVAPPENLVLMDVEYDNIVFNPVKSKKLLTTASFFEDLLERAKCINIH